MHTQKTDTYRLFWRFEGVFFDVGWEIHLRVLGYEEESNVFWVKIWLFEAVIDKVSLLFLLPVFKTKKIESQLNKSQSKNGE